MATEQPKTGSVDMDAEPPRTSMEDHKQTYDAFLNVTKWSIVVIAIILLGLAFFLT